MPTTTAPPILGGISPDDIRRSEGGHLTLTGDEFTRLFRFIGASVRFSAPALASAGDLPDRALEATTGVQKLHEQVDQQWYRKAREKVWSKITYAVKTKLPGKLGKGLRRNDRGVPIWPTAWADWSGKTWKSEDDAYEDILKDLENAVSDNESDGGHSNEDAEEEAIHSGDEDRNMDIDVRPVSPIEQPTAPRAPSIHDVGTSLNDPANRVAHQRSGDESMHRVAPGKTGFGWLFNNGGESSQPKNPSATPQPSVEMRDMPKAIGDRRALGGFLDEYSPRDLSVTTGQAQQDERPKQNAEARLQSMPGSWASPSVGHGPDQGLSSTAPPQEQTSARLQPSYRPAYVEDDPAASAPPRDKQTGHGSAAPASPPFGTLDQGRKAFPATGTQHPDPPRASTAPPSPPAFTITIPQDHGIRLEPRNGLMYSVSEVVGPRGKRIYRARVFDCGLCQEDGHISGDQGYRCWVGNL